MIVPTSASLIRSDNDSVILNRSRLQLQAEQWADLVLELIVELLLYGSQDEREVGELRDLFCVSQRAEDIIRVGLPR